MKKPILLLCLILLLLGGTAEAAPPAAQDLIFTPAGGGKFIYCNNSEGIVNSDLADDTYGSPACIMNNAGLGPDKYVLYLSHFNRTTRFDEKGGFLGGYDIELDAAVTAREDSVLRINRIAFEIPRDTVYYQNGKRFILEDDLASLYGCAALMGETIYKLHSAEVYPPPEQEPVIVQIPAGETRFLSSYIANYAAVPYPKHVFMAAEFEILSGTADLDVIALNTNTSAEARKTYREKAQFGVYKRDRTHKGIADTLPQVSTNLEYTVGDDLPDGEKLPVTVYNQYVPEGVYTQEWCTNLNPQDDTYVRRITAESDMLPLRYFDPSKRSFYGKNVPESEKDDVWIFDTRHSDTKEYPGPVSGYTGDDYRPNYPLNTLQDNMGYGCSQGNYGVGVRYNLKITNTGSQDRYLDYQVTTTANVIVRAEDRDGRLLQPVLAKGLTAQQTTDTMASILLPRGETTEFTIEMTLPVQCYGGPCQAFVLNSRKTEPEFYQDNREKAALLAPDYEGLSELLENADSYTKSIFGQSLHNYTVVATKNGYAAVRNAISGQPFYYAFVWDQLNRLYWLDKQFCIQNVYTLPRPPVELTAAFGKAYVRLAGGELLCTDGGTPVSAGYGEPPRNCGSGMSLIMQDGGVQLAYEQERFSPVRYQGSAPPYIEAGNGFFYYAAGMRAGVSRDGVYWQETVLPSSAERMSADAVLQALPPLPPSDVPLVRVNGEFLGFDTLPVLIDDRLAVPMRYIFEVFGMEVLWDGETGTASAVLDGAVLQFRSMDRRAVVNGRPVQMDIPAYNDNGRLLIPVRFLAETLQYQVDWDAEHRIADISML